MDGIYLTIEQRGKTNKAWISWEKKSAPAPENFCFKDKNHEKAKLSHIYLNFLWLDRAIVMKKQNKKGVHNHTYSKVMLAFGTDIMTKINGNLSEDSSTFLATFILSQFRMNRIWAMALSSEIRKLLFASLSQRFCKYY